MIGIIKGTSAELFPPLEGQYRSSFAP